MQYASSADPEERKFKHAYEALILSIICFSEIL